MLKELNKLDQGVHFKGTDFLPGDNQGLRETHLKVVKEKILTVETIEQAELRNQSLKVILMPQRQTTRTTNTILEEEQGNPIQELPRRQKFNNS